MKRSFTLEYWQEDGCYVGRLREVPGVYSQCESLEGLIEAVTEGYREMMAKEEFPASGDTRTKEIEIEV